MKTCSEIIEAIGSKTVSEALDKSEATVITTAARGRFPAAWFDVIEELSRGAGIECPRERFNFHKAKGGPARAFNVPWPDKRLSPNARVHYKRKAEIAADYRRLCFFLAQEAGRKLDPAKRFRVEVQFAPPDRRRRDVDNLIASLKSCMDGVAKAFGVDDHKFDWDAPKVIDPTPRGRVYIKIWEIEEDG